MGQTRLKMVLVEWVDTEGNSGYSTASSTGLPR